jgi:hypothetical protein
VKEPRCSIWPVVAPSLSEEAITDSRPSSPPYPVVAADPGPRPSLHGCWSLPVPFSRRSNQRREGGRRGSGTTIGCCGGRRGRGEINSRRGRRGGGQDRRPQLDKEGRSRGGNQR